jgi:site-specific DNA-methyltransferase (adenine-specific)|tara:strand:- start:244 stop:1026 length:783 start_codon:yes stop_codon:yes gene_type:complete
MFYLLDCLDGMKKLEDGSVDAIVTSPPYNLNIKYGKYDDDKPRQEYLDWLVEIFREGKRVLKDDGHLFVNMGYSNVDPWVGMEVGLALRQDWILQNHINWVKSIHVNDKTSGHFKPINSKRFVCPTWEHLFHFTKDGKVEIDRLSVGVPYEYYEANIRGKNTAETKPNLRDKGNCWFVPYETINSKELRGKHPATFPVKLVEDCLKLTGKQSGMVLDPFMGTGTTAVAAVNLEWNYIGYDIDQDYVDFATERLGLTKFLN